MSGKLVTVTGGSGFVGQIIVPGLRRSGYEVRVFDRLRGPLVTPLRRRYLGTASDGRRLRVAQSIHRVQRRLEPALVRRGVIRPTWDDIQDMRSRLAERFAGSHAVIHLAGIPHPSTPGAADDDFRRLNYEAAINVFEAAREAGARKFVFASSAQVYGINDPVRIDQFPILESNYLPTLEEGQSMYGHLKAEFERHLERASDAESATQAIALRLEYPGVRGGGPWNFFICTSIENLVAGFVAAIEAPNSFAFDAFNLADAETDPAIADIQAFVGEHWPEIPNRTAGNECLLSTEKARRLLGYSPAADGAYYDESVMW